MKYPMKRKTERPLFEYMLRFNNSWDYYLFDNFDDTIKKAMELSKEINIPLIYELHFDNRTKEWYGQNTFLFYDGKCEYDKHARIDLHIHFYVNAGEWLNLNEEWIKILKGDKNG